MSKNIGVATNEEYNSFHQLVDRQRIVDDLNPPKQKNKMKHLIPKKKKRK